ncbi:MAG: hypothetical protein L0H65_15160, partial [Pseudorhodobacter sp.]|nr:hypothetical protein [Pseudorhodobacter sp.]
MSRGFWAGLGWGTAVAGAGLVAAVLVSEPPVVDGGSGQGAAVTDAGTAQQPGAERAAEPTGKIPPQPTTEPTAETTADTATPPQVTPQVTAEAAPAANDGATGAASVPAQSETAVPETPALPDMTLATPASPQDTVPDRVTTGVVSDRSAKLPEGDAAPMVTTAPLAPMTPAQSSATMPPASGASSAATPEAQTAMATPEAPRVSGAAPALASKDDSAAVPMG